jgi:hypothetical protein
MSDIFEGVEVISSYSNAQMIDDGWKFQLGERLFATTALAVEVAPTDLEVTDRRTGERVGFDPRVFAAFVTRVLDLYNDGVYEWPIPTDHRSDCDAQFATYEFDGHRVWAIQDGDGLHLIRPSDY